MVEHLKRAYKMNESVANALLKPRPLPPKQAGIVQDDPCSIMCLPFDGPIAKTLYVKGIGQLNLSVVATEYPPVHVCSTKTLLAVVVPKRISDSTLLPVETRDPTNSALQNGSQTSWNQRRERGIRHVFARSLGWSSRRQMWGLRAPTTRGLRAPPTLFLISVPFLTANISINNSTINGPVVNHLQETLNVATQSSHVAAQTSIGGSNNTFIQQSTSVGKRYLT